MSNYDPLYDLEDAHRVATKALMEHNPPRYIWHDPDGRTRFRCVTDKPNPHCVGCSETEIPPSIAWRYDPPD